MVHQEHQERIEDWLKTYRTEGVKVDNTFAELKEFAFKFFRTLDTDDDGFLSELELTEAFACQDYNLQQRSFLSLLIRRIQDIEPAYKEEWAKGNRGISLVDIQEYFATYSD
jgi:hypothetical protein